MMSFSDTITILRDRLAALSPTEVTIIDDGEAHRGHAHADSGHYSLTIVSQQFCGLSRLARHRLVMSCVADLIPDTVHALAIRGAHTPEELNSSAF